MIKKRGGFDKINAVKNTRIETVDGDEVSRPGPRIDEGLKDLRDDIYKKQSFEYYVLYFTQMINFINKLTEMYFKRLGQQLLSQVFLIFMIDGY